MVFYHSPAAGALLVEALCVPVAQENGRSCSVIDLVTSGVFALSLFVRGRAEGHHQRYLEKLRLVDTQTQVDCRNLHSWAHTGALLACQSPPYSSKRWRAFSGFICFSRCRYWRVFVQEENRVWRVTEEGLCLEYFRELIVRLLRLLQSSKSGTVVVRWP